jgi:hypothetical protein
MPTDETAPDSADEGAYLVVAALADGEPVDPDALKLALEAPAVRDYLVDIIALRQAVGAANELSAVRWRERPSFRSRIGWASVAAAAVISLAAGYVAGQRTVEAAPAPVVESVVHLDAQAPAPKPTRVISLRPGVNWTEKAGER